ncbi:hypothetical protein AYL99_00173 [Fonsecaea erecta]|uniref:Uncharacterized protein n=1 Tax=Fonsecaea erecta TaxID=1367422 RepID=A0A178ZXP4_9EURO|nr:hypothetical protein AYL99_00173 [Fonsecaea erecta]OAP64201.1 hypothetical protein AYL99_00173 [Fonsecaea erecta]
MCRTTQAKKIITSLKAIPLRPQYHMENSPKFGLRRPLDGLTYKFHLEGGDAKESVYVRSDSAVKMIFDRDFGWSIWDDPDLSASRTLLGRVWDVPVINQGDRPPEGVWVSRKADKSYVYILEYLE